jgi:predicted  nucleic acid-binding Zn-ribbon protein
MSYYNYNDKNILFIQELRTQYSTLDSYLSALEEKLTILEEEKKTVTDRLMASMSQMNKEIEEYKADIYNLKSRNRELENIIKKQDTIIALAAGYISSTSQFSNDHPINVRKWLMGGME